MLAPGLSENPDHRVTTERMRERVEIFVDGEKVAETRNAIKLYESGIEPRIYIPREDITGINLLKFDEYHCPFKGRAELYHIKHGAQRFENGAWSYVKPYDDFREIKNYVAFYPNRVQFIRITG